MAVLLARLAIHYYRPEFTERHATLLIEDFAIDLADFAIHDIEEAIRTYRQNGKNKYFPTSGQLRDLAKEIRKERQDIQAHGSSGFDRRGLEFGETRPSMWWLLRREWWKPHWKESDIPEKERDSYEGWKLAKEQKALASHADNAKSSQWLHEKTHPRASNLIESSITPF